MLPCCSQCLRNVLRKKNNNKENLLEEIKKKKNSIRQLELVSKPYILKFTCSEKATELSAVLVATFPAMAPPSVSKMILY